MRRILSNTRYPAFLLAMSVAATSLVQAGDFDVTGRNDFRAKKRELQAAQFLARATFGYTYDVDPTSDLDVKKLADEIRTRGHRRALSEWIDRQVALPPSTHEPLVLQLLTDDGWTDPYTRPSGMPSNLDYRDYAWWQTSLGAPDQLRQRLAFALMQIVVINRDATIFSSNAADSSQDAQGNNQPRYTGIVHYYDNLVQKAFDDYRTILGDVAYHPVMGVFLTHINNQKPSADGLLLPDENFAREILQLFTMSEYRTDNGGTLVRDRSGNLVQNYTNEDIKALARVFTGLQYAAGDGSTSVNLHDPMEIRNASRHDFDEKVFPTLRFTLPARATQNATEAKAEIDQAIDIIYEHPNVGPYIARLLIQRFVKANPSTTYVSDVANVFNDNGSGVRGDLLAVIRAILLHKEALRSQRYQRVRGAGRQIVGLRVRTRGTEHSKLVEPMLRYTQFIKTFNGEPIDPAKGFRIRPSNLDLNQLPYQAPSVFNYFRPEYQPPGYEDYTTSRSIPNGDLLSPEAQIYTPVFANRFQNLLYRHMHNNYSSTNSYNSVTFYTPTTGPGPLETEVALATSGLAAGNFSDLLQHLDMVMCHGSLSEASKTAINDALVNSGNTNTSELARLAIFGVCGAPESAIDE